MIFVTAKVAEIVGVLQRKFQRFNRMVETHKANLARDVPRGAQNRERVRRRSEADIPDHKFAGMILEPLAESKLVDVKRLGFSDRADDRMKRLVIRERAHGADSIVQADELVAGIGLHNLVLREKIAAGKKNRQSARADCRLTKPFKQLTN